MIRFDVDKCRGRKRSPGYESRSRRLVTSSIPRLSGFPNVVTRRKSTIAHHLARLTTRTYTPTKKHLSLQPTRPRLGIQSMKNSISNVESDIEEIEPTALRNKRVIWKVLQPGIRLLGPVKGEWKRRKRMRKNNLK
jgi:hypothetical protein